MSEMYDTEEMLGDYWSEEQYKCEICGKKIYNNKITMCNLCEVKMGG